MMMTMTMTINVVNLLPNDFLLDKNKNELILMDWMAAVVHMPRHVWTTTQSLQQRYHVWMTSHRARFVVATLLDLIQIVLIPEGKWHTHSSTKECALFLSMFLLARNIPGVSLLLSTQMVALMTAPLSTPAFSYSAVGVLAKLLSTVVQRQYTECETDGTKTAQPGQEAAKSESLLHRLNSLLDEIIRFFDGSLRLTHFKLRLQQPQQREDLNDSPATSFQANPQKRSASFWIQMWEHQNLYMSAVALMLSFPDENNDNSHNQRHAVPASIKTMLRVQLEELELDEEEGHM
jgi:hypothetical protein